MSGFFEGFGLGCAFAYWRIGCLLTVAVPFGSDAFDERAWSNENDQADRAISTGQLHPLLGFHIRPIDVVVFHGSDREYWF